MGSNAMDIRNLDSVNLAHLCAANPEDSGLWSEFLRRITPKIKSFIRTTIRQQSGGASPQGDWAPPIDVNQEADLFQNTILRLVQNSCAALKRFSGSTESELIVYLAVITRSAVRDSARRQSAKRRFHWLGRAPSGPDQSKQPCDPEPAVESVTERDILARELEHLSLQAIKSNSGEPLRDKLIFQLYYYDGLSTAQIAACKGVGLSKTGVEKILNRLKDRVRSAANVYSIEARS
jgi:RNA polymerase sigma factor (sigma-70 family)